MASTVTPTSFQTLVQMGSVRSVPACAKVYQGMGEIFLSIMVSLDGYAADRDGGLDWCLVPDADIDELMAEQLRSIDAMIFGHTAYRELAPYWQDGPTETAVDREQTELMNSVTKLVLSRGQPELEWGPAERIGADLPAEIGKLKDTSKRDIAVFAGPEAANALLPYVDEVRLLVYPVLLGAGRPLFRGQARRLELVAARPFPASGAVQLRYRPVG